MEENDIKSFTFYKDYYNLIDTLDFDSKLTLLNAIVDYVFKDIEPQLTGHNQAIFNTLKHQLDVSKNKSTSTSKPLSNKEKNKKIKSKSNENQMKIKSKSNENQIEIKRGNKTSVSSFLFYIYNLEFYKDRGLLRGKIEEWLNYKNERNELYKEQGFKSLLTKIENEVNKYGEEPVVDLITECMSNNWKGIIWDKLTKVKPNENSSTKIRSEITEGGVRFY